MTMIKLLYVSYPLSLLSIIIIRNKSFSSEVQFHSKIFFYISDTFKSTLNFSLSSCIKTGCYILNLIKISSSDTLPLSRGAAYQDGCFQSNLNILTQLPLVELSFFRFTKIVYFKAIYLCKNKQVILIEKMRMIYV